MELNLIEKFADPELIAEMSLVDKLKATLVTGLTGLCFAVVVLIALMLIVILVRRIVGRYELKQEYRRQVHRARKLRSAKLDKRDVYKRQVTDNAVSMPVMRPLIALDKVDIMDIARDIGTYETSIRPFEDCCTVFLPKHPVTKPKLSRILESESALDKEALIEKALKTQETVTISPE